VKTFLNDFFSCGEIIIAVKDVMQDKMQFFTWDLLVYSFTTHVTQNSNMRTGNSFIFAMGMFFS
jgi:hypothetical protein